jgi:hypothetical protein
LLKAPARVRAALGKTGSGPGRIGLGWWCRLLRVRFIRPASARLRLAALQVLAQGGGEARPLLVVCGWLAAQGINSA